MAASDVFTIYLWFLQLVGAGLHALNDVVLFEYENIRLSILSFYLTWINYKLTIWFIMRIIKGKNTDNDLIDEKEYYEKKYYGRN